MKHFNQQQKIRAVKGPRVRYMKGVPERRFQLTFAEVTPKFLMYYYILLILIVYCLMLTGKNAETFYFVIK